MWALPRPEGSDDTLPRLNLLVRPEHLQHEHARKVVEKLQALRRRFLATTPYDLLAQAVDVLRVRPILLQRHRGQAERALANVDLYLSFSRNYAVRGLRAFAEAMTAAWTDASKAIEGRPDAQEEAVALYTMHAAKGLEWPIVMPVNTMTAIRHPGATVIDRGSGRIHCPVFGVKPTGYDAAYDAEKEELDRERIRLWYVATTRARELLVLPRLDVDAKASSWMSLVDLSIPELTSLDLGGLSTVVGEEAHRVENTQTRAVFAAEAAEIAERHRNILWRIPSRNEGEPGSSHHHEAPEDYPMYADGAEATHAKNEIRGGLERGRILHKLIEEVLTEETPETEAALVTRAQALIHMAGHPIAEDPAKGLAPDELAACVQRALSIPEIASLRPGLLPEFPVYASTLTEEGESVVSGIADAIAFSPSGFPDVVVDWKTDVAPTRKTLDHYRAQVREYLDVTEARRGLIVLVTSGSVVPVTGSPPIDHRLNGTFKTRLAEHEQELPALVRGKRPRVQILQDVDAVFREQFDVYRKGEGGVFVRYRLHAPGVGAHGHHIEAGEILRAAEAQAGLAAHELRRIGIGQILPAGMEQDDIPFSIATPCAAACALISFSLKTVPAGNGFASKWRVMSSSTPRVTMGGILSIDRAFSPWGSRNPMPCGRCSRRAPHPCAQARRAGCRFPSRCREDRRCPSPGWHPWSARCPGPAG